jgi:ATP-dependent DNA helicase RecG
MSESSLDAMVERLRRLGLEPTEIEVKTATGGLPRTVGETLSAFANGDGGTLLLGLDEDGFRTADGFDAAKIRDALATICHQKMSPPIRSAIEVIDFEGAQVVRLDVEELDPVDKPGFITERGENNGSFIRGGDGDRRLSRYEVTQLLSNRDQPTHDQEVIAGATFDDLDPRLVEQVLRHAAERSPRAFAGIEPITALKRLGAVQEVDGTPRPTLAGLLSLGIYPQQFFPQLFASVVVLPTTQMGEPGPEGERFLENVTVDGPIPVILHEATAVLRRNMSRAAIVRGLGREDRYDYPTEVIRELIANALMHRDYSPESRGAQIQIELYPDRLVVKSTGGLFGGVTIDQLGARVESKSRNASLAKLLADVPLPDRPNETIAENRGSGLVTAVAALRKAGMSPPEFDAEPGRLMVTVPRTALLAPQTIEWIASLGLPDLTDAQHLALAIMRSSGRVSVAMLRAWGVTDTDARRAVKGLVARGVAVRTGGKRYASYRLIEEVDQLPLPRSESAVATPDTIERAGIEAELDVIIQAIQAGHSTSRGMAEHIGMGYQTVLRRLRELEARGIVEPTRPKKSSKQSYRVISR